MGSWNKTCGLSNLHIKAGDPVYVFVLEQNTKIDSLCYSTAFYSPLLFPFESVYNDYGGGEKSTGAMLPLILDAIKQELVEMPLGENQYHDIEVSRDKWGEELFFEAVHEKRLFVKARYGTQRPLTFTMFRKDVVDYILDNLELRDYVGEDKGNSGWKNSYRSYKFVDVLKDMPEYLDRLAKKLAEDNDLSMRYFGSLRDLFEWGEANQVAQYLHVDGYRYSRLLDAKELIIELMTKGLRSEAEEVLTEHVKAIYIDSFMHHIRKSWFPGAHEGSQSQEHSGYRMLIAAMNAALDVEQAEMDEENWTELDEHNDDLETTGQPIITWQNVLNYKHLPALGWDLGSFAQEADKLGFPYFCWNDRIYSSETKADTGFVKDDVK
jgi:hypothetical protein